MHPWIRQHLARLPVESAGTSPLITLDKIQQDYSAQALRFLTDTFQLLTSTISIREARLIIEQAARATRLKQLVAVYLPLTLVTGIFGMNVREINGDHLRWWACIVTLVFVILFTSSLFWLVAAWQR